MIDKLGKSSYRIEHPWIYVDIYFFVHNSLQTGEQNILRCPVKQLWKIKKAEDRTLY